MNTKIHTFATVLTMALMGLPGCDDPNKVFIIDYNHVTTAHQISAKNAKEAKIQIETFLNATHPKHLMEKHALGMAIMYMRLAAICRITGESKTETDATAKGLSFYDMYMLSDQLPTPSASLRFKWRNLNVKEREGYIRSEIIDKLELQYRSVFTK